MKFGIFRFASGVLQVFAWICLIFGLIMAILIAVTPASEFFQALTGYGLTYTTGSLAALKWVSFVFCLIIALINWAVLMLLPGILRLLLAIESNTAVRSTKTVSPVITPPVAPKNACPNCGAPVNSGDRFCQSCGAKIGE